MNINEDLKAYLDGELDAPRADEVRRAIEASPDLQQEVEMFKKITHSFQSLKDATVPAQTETMNTVLGPVAVPKPKKRPFFNRQMQWATAILVFVIVGTKLTNFSQAKSASESARSDAIASSEAPAMAKAPVEMEGMRAATEPDPTNSEWKKDSAAKVNKNRPGPAAAGATSNPAIPSSRFSAGTASPTTLQQDRDIVRNATLGLKVESVDKTSRQVESVVIGLGGYVETSQIDASTKASGAAMLVLRIPATQFSAGMEKLRSLGEFLNENTSGVDVTSQIVDVDARLKTLRSQEESYRNILKGTRKTGEVLEVRDRLFSVRQEIEQYTSERANLKKLATFSTITLNLTEAVSENGDKKSDGKWSSETWATAMNGLRSVGQFMGQMLIFVFVYSPVWIPLAGIAFWMNRRAKRTDD